MSSQVFTDILQKYWGYPAFRPMQWDIIESVALQQDTFAILPTGGGKSLCYQVPALYFRGLTVVISPLIALMEDQVKQLNFREVPSAYIHSGLSQSEQIETLNQAISGEIKILYLAPERAISESFETYWQQLPLSFLAIDEAHCISQWGHDFRPSYLKLAELRAYFPKVPVLAVTASATPHVQKDIVKYLDLHQVTFFQQSVVRPNLTYAVAFSENKFNDIVDLCQHYQSTGIVYANSRKLTRSLSDALKEEHIKSSFYHAGLDLNQRASQQSIWMESDEHVMVATNAFGMGIDKPNVRFVTHLILPHSLEEYYQEAGRAGRDEKEAVAVLYYNHGDIDRLNRLAEDNFPPIPWIEEVYHRISDYLKVAVESGLDRTIPFSLEDFVAMQKLPVRKVLAAINLIAQDGYWEFENSAKSKDRLSLKLRSEDMDVLAQHYPEFEALLVTILRTYGSVFNFENDINLKLIAQKLKWTPYQVHASLVRLTKMGYVVFQPAVTGSSITYLKSRQHRQVFRLNKLKIQQLKERVIFRVKAFEAYILNQDTCRNRLIADYFGQDAKAVKPCGKCDNCKRQIRHEAQKDYKSLILELLHENEVLDFKSLQEHLQEIPDQQLSSLIRRLVDEGLIIFDTFHKIKLS